MVHDIETIDLVNFIKKIWWLDSKNAFSKKFFFEKFFWKSIVLEYASCPLDIQFIGCYKQILRAYTKKFFFQKIFFLKNFFSQQKKLFCKSMVLGYALCHLDIQSIRFYEKNITGIYEKIFFWKKFFFQIKNLCWKLMVL